MRLRTQNSDDVVIFENFDGATRDEVQRCENVTTMRDDVARWRVRSLEFHGEGAQATLAGV